MNPVHPVDTQSDGCCARPWPGRCPSRCWSELKTKVAVSVETRDHNGMHTNERTRYEEVLKGREATKWSYPDLVDTQKARQSAKSAPWQNEAHEGSLVQSSRRRRLDGGKLEMGASRTLRRTSA